MSKPCKATPMTGLSLAVHMLHAVVLYFTKRAVHVQLLSDEVALTTTLNSHTCLNSTSSSLPPRSYRSRNRYTILKSRTVISIRVIRFFRNGHHWNLRRQSLLQRILASFCFCRFQFFGLLSCFFLLPLYSLSCILLIRR
ncbi:hypothetical protein KC19_2G013200 [Ceratodon purpureus]|uniref:Uncharacterized protein n=1 Tax=Ceratodon purpureus TaxID=3225 RepID=A0A8T0INW9_CERPU|nr:hypothetical protein KC19_2G013200 [Ceratodon purpureus]